MEPETPYFGGTDLTVPPTHVRPVHGRRGATEPPRRLRLGEALVEAGVITHEQLTRCLAEQADDTRTPRRRLGDIVTARGFASEVDIALGLSELSGFTYVDYAGLVADPAAVRLVPRVVCERHTVIPLGSGQSWVRVAMADPSDRLAIDVLREVTGAVTISVAISTTTAIRDALEYAWSRPADELRAAATAPPDPAPEPAERAPDSAEVDPEPEPETGDHEAWEYVFVGDGMPMDHPGYAMDQDALDRRLTELGGAGWEAVGVHSNGTRIRVLLKRPARR